MYIPKFYEVLFGIYLYILELQNGKYYVGISGNPEHRFREHNSGKTANFVSQNLPIKDYKLELLESTDWKQALIDETNKTIELIDQHGIGNVYGGSIIGDLVRRKRVLINKTILRKCVDA